MKKKAVSVVVTYDDGSTFEWKDKEAQRVTTELTKAYERQFYSNAMQDTADMGETLPMEVTARKGFYGF